MEYKPSLLKKPRLSEKSTLLTKYNQYVFDVDFKANKNEIKKAIENYYHVKVEKVNIINLPNKPIQWRNKTFKNGRVKKAIVTIKEGQKIELGI
jgi:large subunit ribosomal protein L23